MHHYLDFLLSYAAQLLGPLDQIPRLAISVGLIAGMTWDFAAHGKESPYARTGLVVSGIFAVVLIAATWMQVSSLPDYWILGYEFFVIVTAGSVSCLTKMTTTALVDFFYRSRIQLQEEMDLIEADWSAMRGEWQQVLKENAELRRQLAAYQSANTLKIG